MPKNDISKEKSIRRTKTVTELVVCAVIIAAGGYYLKGAFDNVSIVPASHYVDASEKTDIDVPDPAEEIDPDKIIFTTEQFPTRDKFYGDLILVNNDHEYFSTGEEDLVSIMEMNDETGRSFFTAVDYTYTILRPVYEPMAQMVEDFYGLYYNDTLIIFGSYRTHEFQEQLYQNDLAQNGEDSSTLVAKPGFSEHETGYAFDFSETVNYDYQGSGDFEWINENCYKYGFVVRYTEDKEAITQIRPEPWHFRYVGIPHAYYMTKNGLCLEEYIDLLRENYSYENEHLEVTDDDGNNYEIYFFSSDDGEETTGVPVPSGYKYDISGNNVDGFIVTVHKDEKVEPGQEHVTEAPEENEDPDSDTGSDEGSDE